MFPDRSSTFGDLLLDLSEELGLVRRAPNDAEVTAGADPFDNTRRLPDDPATLERIKNAANRGAQDMERADVKWSWLRPTISITLAAVAGAINPDGDISRLRLDRRIISMPLGEIRWTLPDSGRFGKVFCTHADRVEDDLASHPDETGSPRLCAVRPIQGTQVGDRMGYELVVSPKPDDAYVIRARFRMSASPMQLESERPTWPEIHDPCWLACAVVAFYGAKSTQAMLDAKKTAIDESRKIEGDLKPQSLGRLGGGAAEGPIRPNPAIIDIDGNILVP